MPVQTYKKVYANNNVAGYAPDAGIADHLFLYASNTPSTEPDSVSLQPLVSRWNGSKGGTPQLRRRHSVLGRTIFFSQNFDLGNVASLLDKVDITQWWGKLAYWTDGTFSGGPPFTVFPNGSNEPFTNGEFELIANGRPAQSLDDLIISLDVANARLNFGAGTGNSWSVYRNKTQMPAATSASLSVGLAPPKGFVSGALEMSIDWPATRDEDHPLRSAGFLYQARPGSVPPPDQPLPCDVYRAALADEIAQSSSAHCVVGLDPRDQHDRAPWLGGVWNSRLEFIDTVLKSSFFTTKGERLLLEPAMDGRARLGFVFDMEFADLSLQSSGAVIFHPEGSFDLVTKGVARRRAAGGVVGIGNRDLIAGSAATEFFDLESAGVTRLAFVRGQPAVFVLNEDQTPAGDRKILESGGGVAVTSFVSFLNGTGNAAFVPFVSQPTHAPLFQFDTTDPEHLTRRRSTFGIAGVGLPVFPWAGYVSASSPDNMQGYEATHLAQWRRNNVTVQRVIRQANVDNRAVTPQGLLAETSNEGYSSLLFGNADSSNPLQAEFSISISIPSSPVFRDVQQALAGSQLFLVFDRPADSTLAVIRPDAALYIRDFSFSLDLTPRGAFRSQSTSDRTVLLLKYYKGKSLADLVADSSTWSCGQSLAPDFDGPGIQSLACTRDSTTIPPSLAAVWNDPAWQGVLVLNQRILTMPDLIEALRPGVVGELRVHHFGLNFLPARKGDLIGTAPRLGSAFGLIQYTQPKDSSGAPIPPTVPNTDDVEPGTSGAGDRKYSFTVRSLAIEFANSQIADFSAQVDIGFTHLFWDASTISALTAIRQGRKRRFERLANQESLSLFGSYERRVKQDGGTEDVFSLRTNAQYTITFGGNSWLKSLVLSRAQLAITSSVRPPGIPPKPLKSLTAFISVDGDLTLQDQASLPIPFFKVKAIHLANFGFEFDYAPNSDPKQVTFNFRFKADGISADIDFNPPSPTSALLELLPVRLKGMTVALGKLLDLADLGFQAISVSGVGTAFQFGFRFDLDLGFLGNLAGSLKGLQVPMILGWAGGKSPGVSLGVQFPTFGNSIDIGIQQFVRLQADYLALKQCNANATKLNAIAIQATNARLVMFGRRWPDADTTITLFIPVQNRKVSWALSVEPKDDGWLSYLGGGHRIQSPAASSTRDVVSAFQTTYGGHTDPAKLCDLVPLADATSDGWTLVAHFAVAEVDIQFAASDSGNAGGGLYGLSIALPALGDVDVLYRRVSDQLGIFSAEYTLPESVRTIQIGAATLRLPTIRLEVHTDGGFLVDFGYPWQMDFARSCQVEIGIFTGAGGFYYGRTSAAASDLLAFEGGYGYQPPDAAKLAAYRALRLGFAARVGVGRSFTLGILSADASLTILGGLEGAAGYPPGGGQLLSPMMYGVNGFVGLMLDIRAQVSFPLIQARAELLAYALVGVVIRRVLAKKDTSHYFVNLPTIIYAEISVTVVVEVEISIGCAHITIHLVFNDTWRYQETLGDLQASSASLMLPQHGGRHSARGARAPFTWNPSYRYWNSVRDLEAYVTVLPCVAAGTDVGSSSKYQSCVVGQMLLPVSPEANGLGDLVKFLVGWVLRPTTTNGIPDSEPITYEEVVALRKQIDDSLGSFWNGFQSALYTILIEQFSLNLNLVSSENAQDLFASLPLWPGATFSHLDRGVRGPRRRSKDVYIIESGIPVLAADAGFANYCSCVILGSLVEIQQAIGEKGKVPLKRKGSAENAAGAVLTWGALWKEMFAPLNAVRQK